MTHVIVYQIEKKIHGSQTYLNMIISFYILLDPFYRNIRNYDCIAETQTRHLIVGGWKMQF